MHNFNKIAKLHRMFFKRADSFNSYENGDKGQGKYKPSLPSGNTLGDPAPKTAPKPVPNADDWLGHVRSKNTRANSNITITPTPGSASGHEVMTFEPNSRTSPIPPKPGPVSTYKNQGLTPKPWTPRKPREHTIIWAGDPDNIPADRQADLGDSDTSWAATSKAMQSEAQRSLASPYGHLQSNGEVLRGFRYPLEPSEPDAPMDFQEKSLGNLPKLPPREEVRVNNLQ